jgi:hypothetical protein
VEIRLRRKRMLKGRWSIVLGTALLLAVASACSFTTANIRSLKLSKAKDGSSETTTFAPTDSIYALATVANVPSKVSVKFRLITEDVEGQPKNSPVTQFDTTIDMPSDGVGTYSLTPPTAGWPEGKYRIEAAMMIESGEQKDQESVSFTVSR